MYFSKLEAIDLLGSHAMVVKPMVQDIPEVDFVVPILEQDHTGIIDMVLLESKGICLNLFIDDDCVTLNKEQFEKHCKVVTVNELATA